ncbi:MAG: sugar phosphate isomerase/epimerase [Oscillospiraceae bacterium]|nr:sugar phosphate isomerase/epimerase [Oscillospiraceae bacterium]
MSKNKFIVFTKPWRTISLEELGALVKNMGFDGVEYPLRDGYQVQPSDGAAGVKKLVSVLGGCGVTVDSIAGGIDVKFSADNKVTGVNEQLFAGCGEAGVKIIRICQGLDKNIGFFENIDQIKRSYDAVVPYCEKYNVTIGVQMHCSSSISSSAETYILLKDYNPKHIAAVWDSGHNGLTGVEPCFALDTVWDMLCMVNFKAAYWKLRHGPEQAEARWDAYWTLGPHACGSWREAVNHLKKRGYNGIVCMPAEYSDEANVDRYTKSDMAYLKELFEGR